MDGPISLKFQVARVVITLLFRVWTGTQDSNSLHERENDKYNDVHK